MYTNLNKNASKFRLYTSVLFLKIFLTVWLTRSAPLLCLAQMGTNFQVKCGYQFHQTEFVICNYVTVGLIIHIGR